MIRVLVIDDDAVVRQVISEMLADAGYDVITAGTATEALDHFVDERLPKDHPLVAMANVVLTPHIGGATYDTEANHSRLIADDLARLLNGERPLHIVNPEVLG